MTCELLCEEWFTRLAARPAPPKRAGGSVLVGTEGFDEVVEHLARGRCPAEACGRGAVVALAADPLPGDPIARVVGELAEERAQRPTVAIAERMDRVELRVVVGEALDELLPGKPAQEVVVRQIREDARQVRLDVLGEREEALLFGDRDGAQLACPVVDVAEDPAMERLQVPRSYRPCSGASSSCAMMIVV